MVSELRPPEFPRRAGGTVRPRLRRRGQWQGELRQRRRDGSLIITGTQWTLRFDPHTGEPVSIVSTRTDLSALRRVERALSRSEAGLRRAQEVSGVVAFEVAEDGTLVADAAMPALFGLPAATPLTLHHFFARLHRRPRGGDRNLSPARPARRQLHPGIPVSWPGGGQRWLLARGEAEPDPAGGKAPRSLAGIILDVTERRAAETALAESGERLRLAQAAAGFGIYDYDFRTGMVTWDTRMRAFWALPVDAPVTNRLFLAALHPDDRRLRRDAVRQAMDPRAAAPTRWNTG